MMTINEYYRKLIDLDTRFFLGQMSRDEYEKQTLQVELDFDRPAPAGPRYPKEK